MTIRRGISPPIRGSDRHCRASNRVLKLGAREITGRSATARSDTRQHGTGAHLIMRRKTKRHPTATEFRDDSRAVAVFRQIRGRHLTGAAAIVGPRGGPLGGRDLRRAGQVGDQRADLVVGQVVPEPLGHHRRRRSRRRSSTSDLGITSDLGGRSTRVTRVACPRPGRSRSGTRPSAGGDDVSPGSPCRSGPTGRRRWTGGSRGRRGSTRSARGRRCRRTPNRLWHCPQLLAKTDRPRDRASGGRRRSGQDQRFFAAAIRRARSAGGARGPAPQTAAILRVDRRVLEVPELADEVGGQVARGDPAAPTASSRARAKPGRLARVFRAVPPLGGVEPGVGASRMVERGRRVLEGGQAAERLADGGRRGSTRSAIRCLQGRHDALGSWALSSAARASRRAPGRCRASTRTARSAARIDGVAEGHPSARACARTSGRPGRPRRRTGRRRRASRAASATRGRPFKASFRAAEDRPASGLRPVGGARAASTTASERLDRPDRRDPPDRERQDRRQLRGPIASPRARAGSSAARGSKAYQAHQREVGVGRRPRRGPAALRRSASGRRAGGVCRAEASSRRTTGDGSDSARARNFARVAPGSGSTCWLKRRIVQPRTAGSASSKPAAWASGVRRPWAAWLAQR